MDGKSHEQAKYHAMIDSTAEDWGIIVKAAAPFQRDLPNRIVAHLNLLKGDCGGYAVDRLEHSLQTATRAHQAGQDEASIILACVNSRTAIKRTNCTPLPNVCSDG